MQRSRAGAELLCRESLQGSKWRALSLEKALYAVEQGNFPQPSLQDYADLLHRCKKDSDHTCTLRLHAHILLHGLHTHPSLGNPLVALLAHFGCTHDARFVFDSLDHRNKWSWHSLIAGYVKFGQHQQALSLYLSMQSDDSVRPTTHTFVALLKACGKLRDVRMGAQLHADISKSSWLRTDSFVGNALLCMYARCGLLAKAHQVFKDLNVRDVVSWSALIGGYVEHGHGEEAIECFRQMQREGVSPNAVTFVSSLKACGLVKRLEKGREIHVEIERIGLLEKNVYVGSTLVDMYAKCGSIVAGQEVFDKLPIRDAILWNSLITGYAEHGCNAEVIKCFEQMQFEGVAPNAVTFICLLKVYYMVGTIEKCQEIHAEIERKGLVSNSLVVGSTLVDIYAKCGMLAKAQEAFDKLPTRDLIAWTGLISGYVEQGYGEEALNYFEQMQLEGVFPDAQTLNCCLKACGLIGASDEAQRFYSEIERKGLLEGNTHIGSTLVDTYAKCGSLFKMQEVFDKLPVRDVVSWNALISGYNDHGYGEEALKCYDLMQAEGVRPDEVTFVKSLNACGSVGDVVKGAEILAQIEDEGLLEKCVVIGSALVEMYVNCGLLVKAREVFDKLPVRDVVVWNALIAGFAEHGQGEKSLKCFEEMQLEGILPDAVTYVCSLQACASIKAIGKGEELHAEIKRNGSLHTDLIVGNALIDMYVDCVSLVKARQVFEDLPVRDVISWNALIAGYTEHGYGEEALECFEQMNHQGVSPNSGTFASVLKACGSIVATEKGQEIHAEIERKGLLTRNPFVGSTLVNMYAKCGLLAKAQSVFDELFIRDVVSWNALIAGYVEHGHGEEALKSFDRMQHTGVSATTVSFLCSLKACGDIGAVEKGHGLHVEIARKGLLESDLIVGNTLIDMYAKCGLLSVAQQVFDKLSVRDIVSWSSLIAGYAQIGESEKVFSIFDRLRGAGMKPDAVTFLIVLNACSRKGLFNKCETYFESMGRDCGVIPALEHHSCVVDLLSRAGQLDNAVTIIRKMPFCPNLVVWLTLLGACRKWGNVELAKQVFEYAVRLDDKDGAAYVLMSHIYADADMHEAAIKIEAMRQEKAKTWENPSLSYVDDAITTGNQFSLIGRDSVYYEATDPS